MLLSNAYILLPIKVKAAKKTPGQYSKAKAQLQKDKQALQVFVDENLSGKIKRDMDSEIYRYPGFVVMPNCPCPNGSVAKPATGVFLEDCEDVNAFSKWWNTKVAGVGRDTPFDQKLFEYLVMRFVGMAHSFHCTLSGSIEDDGKALEMCTKEQLRVLLDLKSQQWITGPAGSGKTWLLIKKVLMLAENALRGNTEEKILVVCYNRPLFVMLSKTFADNLNGNTQGVVRVKTFESLLYELTRSKPGNSDKEKEKCISQAVESLENETQLVQRYDYIFVDECQDLCGDKWPILFEKLCKGHDEVTPRNIWFLYDTNQYLRLSPQHPLLKRASLSLSTVFRNTKMVFDQSKKYFSNGQSIVLGHHVCGLEIKWDDSLPLDLHNGAKCIKRHVEELKRNKVHDKDICIMTQNVTIRDDISRMLKVNGIENQNAEELFETCEDKVVVESIRRFKGLESKVVILYNPPYSEEVMWNVKELLYTALSRCFCYLIIITTPNGCSVLQSQEGVMEHTWDEFMEIDDD
ncbi:hypothetical protein AWC38_SpisGene10130 [Stylophora pistillata]|uniref:UvrD-like helicase C-terminal domain-containing protein n=1 Tax=Stylophora pistillata TaxID=50429 RepID=A0A2B4S3G8_STYPI|nr:hypothetical protein AWC38_SpisGene10130 [Stylophora pistillata]